MFLLKAMLSERPWKNKLLLQNIILIFFLFNVRLGGRSWKNKSLLQIISSIFFYKCYTKYDIKT